MQLVHNVTISIVDGKNYFKCVLNTARAAQVQILPFLLISQILIKVAVLLKEDTH